MPEYTMTLRFSSALELSLHDIERLVTNAIITEVGQAVPGDPIANVERTTLQILTISDGSGAELAAESPHQQQFRQTIERRQARQISRPSRSPLPTSSFSDEPLIDEEDEG